ncbi:MAG TPA: LysR family transcriptional regulator [Ottowia sp.]|uniref:LysR family transcriptional regulator n=1 Tax=Ottowia sp. TaxID=1898956 RepID=UPI002B5D7CEB|nr:LysR family transcriptional regulator [Ottowia sp.]HRN05358.1 LysR family transcriptional regulator [Ottowia sp.]
MNLRQLAHLTALAEQGSFSRAAECLHLTQSALSRSLQTLEDELGARLIDRAGKRSTLTPLGEAVLARARRITLEAAEIQRSAELLRQGEAGNIRVGLGSGPGALLMTPLLTHVAAHYPQVRVAIARGSTELQVAQLRQRELDALVVDARRISYASDLVIEPLTELRGGFVSRAGHPLAQLASVSFAQLMAYPVATTPLSDEVARMLVAHYGPGADPARMAALVCEDVGSLLDAVAETDAVFLGVIAAARSGIEAGRLAELRMAPPLAGGARFAYVRLAGRTEAPVMQVLRRFVVERLRDW